VKKIHWIVAFLTWLASGITAVAQIRQPDKLPIAQPSQAIVEDPAGAVCVNVQREKHALLILLKLAQEAIISAADAMPADKFGFVPTDGEFKGVRTFGQQVKHLAATNYILSAAALGERPPTDAGDEMGPESVRTKAEILDYLRGSFAQLAKAIDAFGDSNVPVMPSPISPLKGTDVTRNALIMESLVHTFDHYGQMVEYLRMNGVVPPASRP
jgi:uncharacterized damage-inducible protein DinB